VLCGLTLEHGPAHFYRAVLEGCAFGIRNVASIFECGGVRIDEMRACGSGANNRLWVQILASVTGKPVLVSSEKDATCLGSAMCAAVAAGLHSSLEEAAAAMQPDFERVEPEAERRVYDELFRSYLSIYKNMKGDMHALARISEGSV
jgi:ribulose kinase